MYTIVIYGDKKENEIKSILIGYLKHSYSLNILDGDHIYSIGKGSQLNIVITNSLSNIEIKNCILILTSSSKINNIKYLNKYVNVIINANDLKSISKLAKYGSNIYTCGFCSKDYITFSSRDDEYAVVSLQRSIRLSEMASCEPFEIPCELKAVVSDYAILASVLTLILMQNISEKKSNLIAKIYL